MENLYSGCWSELSIDILIFLFERLSFVDFHRAKIVCPNWYLCSKATVRRKNGSPWVMLFQEDDGVLLFNPDEGRVYRTKRDFSGTRFLASSGNWFLVLDSGSNLYIMDVFSEKRINLPPLDSIKGGLFSLKLVGNKQLNWRVTSGCSVYVFPQTQSVEDLKALLWVDEKKEEYTVAWFLDSSAAYIAFCKNGEDYYRTIPTRIGVRREFQGISDMVLRADMLYVYTTRQFIRLLDLSGQEGFKEVCNSDILPFQPASYNNDDGSPYDLTNVLKLSYNIAVTTSGEVLLVESIVFKAISEIPRIFHIFKTNPNLSPDDIFYRENLSVEVDSLGDEALLLDLGITVPADRSLGIEPNSIYFTRHDRVRNYTKKPSCVDICVFNLATKKLTHFPILSDLKPKDARCKEDPRTLPHGFDF